MAEAMQPAKRPALSAVERVRSTHPASGKDGKAFGLVASRRSGLFFRFFVVWHPGVHRETSAKDPRSASGRSSSKPCLSGLLTNLNLNRCFAHFYRDGKSGSFELSANRISMVCFCLVHCERLHALHGGRGSGRSGRVAQASSLRTWRDASWKACVTFGKKRESFRPRSSAARA